MVHISSSLFLISCNTEGPIFDGQVFQSTSATLTFKDVPYPLDCHLNFLIVLPLHLNCATQAAELA